MTTKAVAVFGSSATRPNTPDWDDAEVAGQRLASAGLTVVTGGYGGSMEAASRGAASRGGHVIGVTMPSRFMDRSGANPYVVEERPAETLNGRIGLLTGLANAVIALPGSIGTAAELLIAWNLNHISRSDGSRRLPTVAVGPTWAALWELLTVEAGARPEDVHLADDVHHAIDWVLEQPEIR